jgi:phosphatidate cytidylyltransferase
MGAPQQPPVPPASAYSGRRRSADDHAGTEVVDEHLVAVDTTPTGRHSRLQLEAMIAEGEARDAATSATAATLVSPVAPEPPAVSKAGRNLPAAIGVGLGLGAAIIASLAFRREAFLAIVIVAVLYGTWELRQAMRHGGIALPLVPLLVGGVAMALSAWNRGSAGLVVAVLLTGIATVVWRTADGDDPPGSYARDAGAGILVALYLPFLAGFAILLTRPDDGAGRVIALFVTVVCSDVGGYAVGVLIGRHPMAPLVSPKKSWEGFGGSAVSCATAGALLFALLFHQQWWQGALYGLAIAATATVGDLGESMLKRDLGIKDMGRLLPGHGGLMDRLDSLLPSAAVAYLLLSAFVP